MDASRAATGMFEVFATKVVRCMIGSSCTVDTVGPKPLLSGAWHLKLPQGPKTTEFCNPMRLSVNHGRQLRKIREHFCHLVSTLAASDLLLCACHMQIVQKSLLQSKFENACANLRFHRASLVIAVCLTWISRDT